MSNYEITQDTPLPSELLDGAELVPLVKGGAPACTTWGSMSAAVEDMVGDLVDEAHAWAEGTLPGGAGTKSAKEWSEESALSAATAEAAAGPTYASTAAGLAATTSGQAFAVDAGGGLVSVYLNSSGTAVLQRTLATTAALAASGGAGLVGFSHSATYATGTLGAKGRLTINIMDAPFNAAGDGVADDTTALQSAIDYANATFSSGLLGAPGAIITTAPGAIHRFSGRLRLKPGVTLDFGRGGSAAKLIAIDSNGGIEQVGGSGLRAELRTENASFIGPMLELNSAKSTLLGFGRNERLAWFDVGLRGDRQPGSKGLLMTDDTGGGGVAWVMGRADIGELDYPFDMVSNGTGYVNENWLDLRIFDGVEYARMLVNGTGEVAANRINLTTQTGINSRSGIALKCDGQRNTINLMSWDWVTARVNPSYDGTQVLLTDKSGANTLRGYASRGLTGSIFSKPAVVDLAPEIRKNWVLLDDQRISAPDLRAGLPNGYLNYTMLGDQDDELAFASSRWTVTNGGATPPTAWTIPYLFQPDGYSLEAPSCTEATVTVDFGSSRSGSDFNTIALLFASAATKPDKVKVDFSTDAVTWTTVLQAGYDGGSVPNILHRVDGGGLASFRYVRLKIECNAAKTVRVARMILGCHGTSKTGGAWMPKFQPTAYRQVNVVTAFGGDGFYVDGKRVVTTRKTGWTADTGTAKRTANTTYTAPTISATYTQAEVQSLANALQDASRTIKALKDDLISHGLIGA